MDFSKLPKMTLLEIRYIFERMIKTADCLPNKEELEEHFNYCLPEHTLAILESLGYKVVVRHFCEDYKASLNLYLNGFTVIYWKKEKTRKTKELKKLLDLTDDF